MQNRLVILGAGESGTGTAVLAKKKNWEVFVSDYATIKEPFKKEFNEMGVEWEENKHSEKEILKAQCAVKSPGISDKAPIVLKLLENNIPVISEIEFAGKYTRAKIIGITGSNGKTTTTLLIYKIMKAGGLNVALAGNIGTSFARKVAEKEYDYFVLELSSFQLDGIKNFRNHIAVLLNITPDHLDRYNKDFQQYLQSKFRIVKNQKSEDVFVYNADDKAISAFMKHQELHAIQYQFSQKKTLKKGAFVENDQIQCKIKNEFKMYIKEINLQGKHNIYNSMAAAIVGNVLKIENKVIRGALSAFKGVEHRLERVLSVRNIEFINDSKATNINACWYAMECMQKPVIWIAGGVDKGNDYSMLQNLVDKKVKAIICLTKDSAKIHSAFENLTSIIIDTESMQQAVKIAYELGERGDTVLLSPACASFDLFKNFEDRGQQFKEAVRNL